MSRVLHSTVATERAVLIYINPDSADDEYVEQELEALAASAGLEVVGEFRQRRTSPDTATFIGRGKAEELFAHVRELDADVVILDGELSPLQQRNLEDILQTKVIDRTQLILDLFAQRAHTREGVLQVELAQLMYLMPRLTGKGTILSRLGGGIGTRGPGETKLEMDRRRIRDRITHIRRDLEEVRRQHTHQRLSRRRLPFPFGAIVGYTNAGKSTLLNTLSGAEVYTDDRLFATLDPTTRRVVLPDGWSVILTDTVGFIHNLPHTLIAAFRATLEEVQEADFLIHVIDVSSRHWELQRDAVYETLAELEADDKPMVTVFNKADQVKDSYWLRQLVVEYENSVYLSARYAQGIPHLMDRIVATVQSLLVTVEGRLPYSESNLLAECYEYGRVLCVDYRQDAIYLHAQVIPEIAARLKARFI